MNGFSIEIGVIQALEAIPCVDVLNTINTNNIPPTSVIKQLAIAVEYVFAIDMLSILDVSFSFSAIVDSSNHLMPHETC